MKLTLTLAIIILAIRLNAGAGTYYNYYENLSNEPTSALSTSTGQNIFDFLPIDIDNIDLKNKLLISTSLFVLQGGDDYGSILPTEISRMENIDFAKHFSIIYNYKPNLMPFISFYTPYKQVLDYGLSREITKKRDVLSAGWISYLGKHQFITSVDYLMSSYHEKDGVAEGDYKKGGFSARFLINVKVNERSSMFFGATTEPFLEFDIDEKVENEFRYFNGYEANMGLNYKAKLWYCIYSAMYRTYEIFYDDDYYGTGSQLNYPWVLEHKIILGKHFNKNMTASVSYELLPSSFTSYMPDIGDRYRHSLGIFLGLKMKTFDINISYTDSKFLSEESLGKSAFQMDVIYKLR
ncbi:MAG: hypothetical protein KAS62_06330 [Candidatus Delongbacteria bacterium]|nr:hypothetical protein [Candidatus Delongbacteria bacterium]